MAVIDASILAGVDKDRATNRRNGLIQTPNSMIPNTKMFAPGITSSAEVKEFYREGLPLNVEMILAVNTDLKLNLTDTELQESSI